MDNNEFRLAEGKILHFLPRAMGELPIPVYIRNIFPSKESVYYLRTPAEDDTSGIFTGIYNTATKMRTEIEIPETIQATSIIKFQGFDGIVYLLSKQSELEFYRIDLNSKEIIKKTGVTDFFIYKKKIFIIQQTASADFRIIDYRDREVPLTISGSLFFNRIEDGRICFISNGQETEIVDIITMRNLYRYSENIIYLMPKEFNIIVEAYDDIPGSNVKDMLFYKIFINGKEKGRTETGPSPEFKHFQTLLPSNRYYHIAAEKWVLDRRRKQYIRSNNINQPPSVRVFIPGNRVIRMRLTNDGKKYRHTAEAMVQSE